MSQQITTTNNSDNRLATLKTLVHANELKISALLEKNKELLAQHAEIQTKIREYDPQHSFTYYALSVGALKEVHDDIDLTGLRITESVEVKRRDCSKERGRDADEDAEPEWEDINFGTPTPSRNPSTSTTWTPRASLDVATAQRSQPLDPFPPRVPQNPPRRVSLALSPAPRSLAFAIPTVDGNVLEFPIETRDLAAILRETLEREGWNGVEVDEAVKVFIKRPVVNVLPRRV
jgi:hypothetical protein